MLSKIVLVTKIKMFIFFDNLGTIHLDFSCDDDV